METKLNEAKDSVEATQEATALTESKLRIAEDRYTRKETLNELMAPLGKERRKKSCQIYLKVLPLKN